MESLDDSVPALPQSPEAVKHRRTRSGCFTCRARRVKCDETQPTCERCRKGNRECKYPDPPRVKTSKGRRRKQINSPTSPLEQVSPGGVGEENEYQDSTQNSSILGNISPYRNEKFPPQTLSEGSIQGEFKRQQSDTPSLMQSESPTPSTEGSMQFSEPYTSTTASRQGWQRDLPRLERVAKKWSHLSRNLQFYLNYHQKELSYLHYSIKHDPEDFIGTTFLELAVCNEPLLYAVAGFAAFHYTLQNSEGRIGHFFDFYHTSASLLRQSLLHGKHNVAAIFTILQLATIEELLGDWVNLLGHQRAAYEILTELYTPASIMQSITHRMILDWYSRFDLFAGLLAGHETVLGPEWFQSCHQYYVDQSKKHPENVDLKLLETIASSRILAMDITSLFAKAARGLIPAEQFLLANDNISSRLAEWQQNLDPQLTNPEYLVNDFDLTLRFDQDDIFSPYLPGTIYKGPLFNMNFIINDFHALRLMYLYQSALKMQVQMPVELTTLAMDTCQLYAVIDAYTDCPPGSVIATEASLSLAILFLPKDPRYISWSCRKLANVESHGHIHPSVLRKKLSELWELPYVEKWWLPNGQGLTKVLRSIRDFAFERTAVAKDAPSSDLKDMKALFSAMKLNDGNTSPVVKDEFSAQNRVVLCGPGSLDNIDGNPLSTDLNF
ncbi:MAG: hypothetical protein M1829_002535 [Trizodia sp. TS-e1964]|nr:MAG: hypothetical protein M1829_002535 [Trizodia sp. TS-e1964]